MRQNMQTHLSGKLYRNLRSSRGLLRRENNEGYKDKEVSDNQAGELNRIILLSCFSHNDRIKNEHDQEFHCDEFCFSMERVPALDYSYKRCKRDPCAEQN
jgi:hypothetical protein